MAELLLQKVDRYLRNHNTARAQKASRRSPAPAPTARAISWQQIMAQDNKAAIAAQTAAFRATEGVSSPSDRFRHFKRAQQEVADTLPQVRIEGYKELARVVSQNRKVPLTLTAAFK